MIKILPGQPAGILDLIGLSFRFWHRNINEILRFLLVPSVLASLAGISLQWLAGSHPNLKHWAEMLSLDFIAEFLLSTFAYLATWWWLGLRLLAIVRCSLGFSDTLEDARIFMAKHRWRLPALSGLLFVSAMSVSILWMVIMLSGLAVHGPARAIAIVFTMMIGLLGLIATLLFYTLVANFAYCLIACENDTGAIASMVKSLKIIGRHTWRTLLFGSAFLGVFLVVSIPLSLPASLVVFFDFMQHGLSANGPNQHYITPLYVVVINNSWEAFIGLLLRPLTLCAWGYYYLDLRMRTEGLDLRRSFAQIQDCEQTQALKPLIID